MVNKKPNNLTVNVNVGSALCTEVVNDGSTMEIAVKEVAENEAYLQSFPPGYRFAPRDDELVEQYLECKIANRPLPISKIRDVNIYRFNPQDLAVMYNPYGDREKEWYFFTPRDRKYPNGNRPNRAAGNGCWKATGADTEIHSKASSLKVGYRKALVFYEGKPPKGTKTKWIMHEYRVNHESPRGDKSAHGMRLDDWVLCRIYHKTNAPNSKGHTNKKKTLALPNSEEDGPIWNPASEYDEYSPEPENLEPIFDEDGRDELNTFCDGFDGQFYGSYCGPIIPSSKTDESLALTDMNCIEFSPLSVVSKLYQNLSGVCEKVENQVCQDSYYDPLSGDELLLNIPPLLPVEP